MNELQEYIQKEIPKMKSDLKKTTRKQITLELDGKNGAKKPLSIKVDQANHDRLKIARFISAQQGAKFNVSLHLEKHLVLLMDMLEEQFEYNHEDYEIVGNKVKKKVI